MSGHEDINVFFVEDDRVVAELVRAALRHAGYTVTGYAVSGEQALELLPALMGAPTEPAVVLMDYLLPGINGLETVQVIMDRWPLPVVMLTAYDASELVAEASAAGVGAYLIKPPTARELERAITIAMARFDDLMALRAVNGRLERTLADLQAAERRLVEQERMAAVGKMATHIAHNFNNILMPVLLYADLTLQTPELPTKVRERMQSVIDQVRHAVDLVQGMLDFSGSAWLKRKQVDLVVLVQETLVMLGATWPEDISIVFDHGTDHYIVDVDPVRIQQILVNLVVNAREAMPLGGRLRLAVERVDLGEGEALPLPDLTPGAWVRASIEDTGTGILPAALPHIFEPFFTTQAPLKVGMGLAQVYGIVAQHGGHTGVTSEVGKGTVFVFYLPAVRDGVDDAG